MLIELGERSILRVECASILPKSSSILTDAARLFQRTTVATLLERKAIMPRGDEKRGDESACLRLGRGRTA